MGSRSFICHKPTRHASTTCRSTASESLLRPGRTGSLPSSGCWSTVSRPMRNRLSDRKHEMDRLLEGYLRFRRTVWPAERDRYESLAQRGQRPQTLVIACSDSRVDPQTVFGAAPGEL